MLTFIPWVLLVLQKKESSDLDSGGTLPGLCLWGYDIVFKSLLVVILRASFISEQMT